MTTTLEILHVSDVHLANKEPNRLQKTIGVRRGSEKVANALANTVHTLVNRDDVRTVGVLSGDLSTLGHENDIGAARYWWETNAGSNSIYVLGNHDFWNGRPGRTALRHAGVHKEVRAAHWPLPNTILPFVIDGMRVTIYEIDTTPSQHITGLVTNVLAHGAPEAPLVRELRAAVNTQPPWSQGPDVGVVVMHHPVTHLRKGVIAIAELNHTPRINLVLAGHTHNVQMNRFGFVEATCGSSTIVERKKPAPSFLVHALNQNGSSVWLQSTLWKFDGHSFVAQPTKPPIELLI